MELSTYFRINCRRGPASSSAPCSSPRKALLRELPRRLHGTDARREPAARRCRRARRARRRRDQVLDGAELVPGRQGRRGRHLQLRDQARRVPRAARSKISWTQVETGSAITWKYPSCILQGDDSVGEFYSVADDEQQAAGRHRHEDDPHREEHEAARSSRRASRRDRARTELPRPGAHRPEGRSARATTRSATRCCSATSAARTPSPTSK